MNVARATQFAKENLQTRLPGKPRKPKKVFQPRFNKTPDPISSDRLKEHLDTLAFDTRN